MWLLPNPPTEFEPETEVWRDVEVDGSHTLTDFHEGIFEVFDRRDTHAYEFLIRDEHGIATRSYAHSQMYSGDQSWQPMSDDEIDRFLEHAIPDDVPEDDANGCLQDIHWTGGFGNFPSHIETKFTDLYGLRWLLAVLLQVDSDAVRSQVP